MFLFSLQDWLGTRSAPIWLTLGPGVLAGVGAGGGGCAGPARPVGWARAPRSPWLLLPGSAPSLVAASALISVAQEERGSQARVGLQSEEVTPCLFEASQTM